MYTSGTTGKPKGAIRNHRAGAMLSLATEVELTISRNDTALLAQGLGDADRQASRNEEGDCGPGAPAGRDYAPHMG